MNFIVGLIIVALIIETKTEDYLPQSFRTCRRSSPEFLQCTSKAAVDAIVSMADGFKSFKILPIDPLEIGEINIGKNRGIVSVMQSYKNAKLHGISKGLKINFDLIDLEKLIIRGNIYNDQIDFVADYTMDGRVLIVPIDGRGRSNITMIGLNSRNTMNAEKYEKNGEIYLRIKKYKCKFTPAKVLVNFTNLFNGDAALSERMNKFLNQNSKIVFEEIQGEYQEAFALIFAKIANDVFRRIPLRILFPE